MKPRPNLPPWPPAPTTRGANGRLLCRCGCGRETTPPRRTWATPECIERVRLTCDWSVVRKHIYDRDKGICQICSCHPESIRAGVLELFLDGDNAAIPTAKEDGWPRTSRVWYEIDHIQPVCEGGAKQGRKNLRVLCYRCHKTHTKAQNLARKASSALPPKSPTKQAVAA